MPCSNMKTFSIENFGSRLDTENRNSSSKKFACVWLFYPSVNAPKKKENDYLYGSIINSRILRSCEQEYFAYGHDSQIQPGKKKMQSKVSKEYSQQRNINISNTDYDHCIDYILLTPSDLCPFVKHLISCYFDIHVEYCSDIFFDFLGVSQNHWSGEEKDKWSGVTNKLYIFHPDLFGCYNKVLFLDSDFLIKSPSVYLSLFNSYDTPAGCYEYSNILLRNKEKTQLVTSKRFRNNQVVPQKFCTAGTKFYHCVNASLLLIDANEQDYSSMKQDMENTNNIFYKRHPQLQNHILYFPEQEYLTNFFAGRWHSFDHSLLSTKDSPHHISGKFWTFKFFDRQTGIPNAFLRFFLEDSSG